MSDKAIEAAAKGIHFAKDCHREWIDGGRNCDCWEAAKVTVQAWLDAGEPVYEMKPNPKPDGLTEPTAFYVRVESP